MMKRVLPSLTAVAVALGASVAAAQEVPTLDVGPLCRAQAKAAQELADACLADEKRAREDLVRQWAQSGRTARQGASRSRKASPAPKVMSSC